MCATAMSRIIKYPSSTKKDSLAQREFTFRWDGNNDALSGQKKIFFLSTILNAETPKIAIY